MDFTDGIRAFVAVVEAGSFTAAAQRLGISNKLASKYVAALEDRLGRSLLYRTTRSLSLTEDGERWLPHARGVLDALEAADAALKEPEDGLSGRLRITAGTTLGELCLADAARDFLEENPDMRVDLVLSDTMSDLVTGGFDLAVRIGVPKDSSYKMLRVGATTPCIAASPAYLARHGSPAHPRDLDAHRAILDLNEDRPGRWPFRDRKTDIVIDMKGGLAVNNAAVTIRQAVAGHGILRAPDIFLAPSLSRGDLVTVLDDFAVGERTIHMLTNSTAFGQRKIKAFASVLRRRIAMDGQDNPP